MKSVEQVARAPADKTGPAEKVASALAEARSRRRRRKYVAVCTKDAFPSGLEQSLHAVAKETARPGFRLVEAVFDSGAEGRVSTALLS